MPRLELDQQDDGMGSSSRGVRRGNSGSRHGKGKKRVSDEGMGEEEGLLSGLSGRIADTGGLDIHDSVSCRWQLVTS
jgi:hypothetical protein